VNLYIHSPIHLHGVVLNWLSTETTLLFALPYIFFKMLLLPLLVLNYVYMSAFMSAGSNNLHPCFKHTGLELVLTVAVSHGKLNLVDVSHRLQLGVC
jgi:hypothetical protein